jgi:hypothetical protein
MARAGVETTPLWAPFPNSPQQAAYLSEADELFYGGAAGGGKSWLLLGLALTAHRRSIIYRREYPQLRDMITSSAEIIAERGRFNENLHIWRDLPGDRMLEFGAVHNAHDVQNFKGRAHDLKAFDELPDFLEQQYVFLNAWLRTPFVGQRVRTVATGNPPSTPEGQWVVKRWAAWLDKQHPCPAKPGELRWYAMVDNEEKEVGQGPFDWKGEVITPRSRTFIPAFLADNPVYAATGYSQQLQALPEPLRSQLLWGNFEIGMAADPWQVIPQDWVEEAVARWTPEAPDVPATCVGLDVARGGDDKTVSILRIGRWFQMPKKIAGKDTPDGPSVLKYLPREMTLEIPFHVDVIGVGGSVYDHLKGVGVDAKAVNFAEASSGWSDRGGNLRFKNMRAELWWKMREALDPDFGLNLAIPPDPELKADLVAPKWKLTPQGIQIESKDDIRLRIGRSTDCGDALVMALIGGGATTPAGELRQGSRWQAGSDEQKGQGPSWGGTGESRFRRG